MIPDKSIIPDKRNLYRWPWSLNDNPIGWVEVTDICNIHCKGCYRQKLAGHKPLEEIKKEVLFLKQWRNVDNISIAGGEALIHPEIVDIVDFITHQGLKSFILSNGVRLTEDLLRDLKRAGLTGIGFHIDSLQKRPHWTGKNEIELCELRQYYADLVAEVGMPPAGFGMTVYRDNFPYIPDVLRWIMKNRGKVGGGTFITYRGAETSGVDYYLNGRPVDLGDSLSYMTDDAPEDIGIKSTDVYAWIKQNFPGYEASGYLGGTQSHDSFKWLDGYMLCAGDEILGSLGKKSMEFVQVMHHLLFGTYFVYLKGSGPSTAAFLLALIDKDVRHALGRYLRNPFRRVYGVSVAIVQAPDLLPDGRVDMCDSCPDMTYFEGRLVNSCRLDEYRKFGQLVTAIPRRERERELA